MLALRLITLYQLMVLMVVAAEVLVPKVPMEATHTPAANYADKVPEPVIEPLPAASPLEVTDVAIDEGWEVAGASDESAGVMTGDDAVLEASLGLGPPPTPAGQRVERDPALTALLSAIRKDIDG